MTGVGEFGPRSEGVQAPGFGARAASTFAVRFKLKVGLEFFSFFFVKGVGGCLGLTRVPPN